MPVEMNKDVVRIKIALKKLTCVYFSIIINENTERDTSNIGMSAVTQPLQT